MAVKVSNLRLLLSPGRQSADQLLEAPQKICRLHSSCCWSSESGWKTSYPAQKTRTQQNDSILSKKRRRPLNLCLPEEEEEDEGGLSRSSGAALDESITSTEEHSANLTLFFFSFLGIFIQFFIGLMNGTHQILKDKHNSELILYAWICS